MTRHAPSRWYERGKAVVLLAVPIVTAAALMIGEVPYSVVRAVSAAFTAANLSTLNYTYSLHVIRHGRSWNFFEGFCGRHGWCQRCGLAMLTT